MQFIAIFTRSSIGYCSRLALPDDFTVNASATERQTYRPWNEIDLVTSYVNDTISTCNDRNATDRQFRKEYLAGLCVSQPVRVGKQK